MAIPVKTVAESFVSNLEKIAKSLKALESLGIPRGLIEAYIYDKTNVKKADIRAVLDSLGTLSKEMAAPMKE